MSDDIKRVYTGSDVEAMYLEDLLKKNGIGSIRRNRLQSSIDAGWANGSPEDSTQLYVESSNLERANELLEEYFKSRK